MKKDFIVSCKEYFNFHYNPSDNKNVTFQKIYDSLKMYSTSINSFFYVSRWICYAPIMQDIVDKMGDDHIPNIVNVTMPTGPLTIQKVVDNAINNTSDYTQEFFSSNSLKVKKVFQRIIEQNQIKNQHIWDEEQIYSIFLVNDFINSSSTLCFKDYYEKNEERIDDLYSKFDFVEGKYTDQLFSQLLIINDMNDFYSTNNSHEYYHILMSNYEITKKNRKILANLTVNDFRKILDFGDVEISSVIYSLSDKSFPSLTNTIQRLKDDYITYNDFVADMLNKLNFFVQKDFQRKDEKEYNYYPIIKMFNYSMDFFNNDVVDNDNIQNLNKKEIIFSNEITDVFFIKKIFDFMYKHHLNFSSVDFIAILLSFSLKCSFYRSGRVESFCIFLKDRYNTLSTEDFIVFLHFISHTVLCYDDVLPTVTEWKKYAQSDPDWSLPIEWVVNMIVKQRESKKRELTYYMKYSQYKLQPLQKRKV